MKASELSAVLKERRKATGVTQRDVAELCDVAVHTISDLESGKGNPTLDVLARICEVLGLEITLQPRSIEGFGNPLQKEAEV